MNWYLVFYAVLTVLAVVLVFFIGSVLLNLAKTLNSLNALIIDVRSEVTPLLSELRTTLCQVNNELTTVDDIVKSVQEVSEKVNAVTAVAQEIISSPLIKLASFSAGAKKAVSTLLKRREK